jgi:hypothetical protein
MVWVIITLVMEMRLNTPPVSLNVFSSAALKGMFPCTPYSRGYYLSGLPCWYT